LAHGDNEYNWWYDAHHAPDVVATPGYMSEQRLVAADRQLQNDELPGKYWVIYKIVTDDLASTRAGDSRRHRTGIIPVSPPLDLPSTILYIYDPIGPAIEREGHAAGVLEGKLQTFCLLVFSNPVPGKEQEYNDWYDDVRAPRNVVAMPGFVNGQRLTLVPIGQGSATRTSNASADTRPKPQYQHLLMFKIVTKDLASVFKTFNQRSLAKVTSPTSSASVSYTFKTHGPLIDGDKVRAQGAGITVSPCP
jgi:hypothetical protein